MSVRLSVPSSDCSKAAYGFAAERPAGRRYRSIAAGTVQQAPELRSKCGQCHADSQRRRLHMDLFLLLRHVRRLFNVNSRLPEVAAGCIELFGGVDSTRVGKLRPACGPPEYIMRPAGTCMFARFLKFYSEYLI